MPEFTIDINARPLGEPPGGDIGDDLLDALAAGRVVIEARGAAVSQDLAAGIVGATFTVETDDIDAAYVFGRVLFGHALARVGLAPWRYTSLQVSEPEIEDADTCG